MLSDLSLLRARGSRSGKGCALELLEQRVLLAAVAWDGGGGDAQWSNPLNWNPDGVPTSSDEVAISVAENPTIQMSGGSNSIHSLVSDEALELSGGSLAVASGATVFASLTVNGATVTFDGPTIVSSLALSSGQLGGAGLATVTSAFDWTGGLASGDGAIVVETGATLVMSGNTHDLRRTLDNNGMATWTSGQLLVSAGAFNNNGTFIADCDDLLFASGAASAASGAGAFNNSGLFIKEGSGRARFTRKALGLPLYNSGTVEVRAGTLWAEAGGSHSGGFAIAMGALLQFSGTHMLPAGSHVSGPGSLEVRSGATTVGGSMSGLGSAVFSGGTATFGNGFTGVASTVVSGGVVSFNGEAAFAIGSSLIVGAGAASFHGETSFAAGSSLAVNGGSVSFDGETALAPGTAISVTGGTVQGSTTLTVPASVNVVWTGGSILGGDLILEAGSMLTISGNQHTLGRPLRNEGVVLWTAGELWLLGVTVTNDNTFVMNNASSMTARGAGGAIVNNGTVEKAGVGVAAFSVVSFSNNGIVDAGGGKLGLWSGGTHTGDFTIATGAILEFGALHTLPVGSDISGPGHLSLNAGTFTDNGSVDVGSFATINSGRGIFTGSVVVATSLEVDSNGAARFDGPLSGGTLVQIYGVGTFNTPPTFMPGAVVAVAVGELTGAATLTIAAGQALLWSGRLTGSGAVVISPGATLTMVGGYHELGRTLINNGTATWVGGRDCAMAGGTFINNGTFTAEGDSAHRFYGVSGTNVFENNGAFIKQGTGTTQFLRSTTGVLFTNSGVVDVRAGMLNFISNNRPTNYDHATNTLTGGTWKVANDGNLAMVGASIRTLGAGTAVTLAGLGSVFAAVNVLTTNNGSLTLADGRTFNAAPVGGVLTNNGELTLGRSTMIVTGSFVQTPSGVLAITIAEVADHGKLAVTGTAQLDGTLVVEYDGYTLARGDAFELLSAASVSRTFASALLGGIQNLEIARLAYESGSVVLNVLAAGDFDGDGFVTGEDYDLYVQAFESGDFAVDMDGDGFITGVDFDLFVAAFELG